VPGDMSQPPPPTLSSQHGPGRHAEVKSSPRVEISSCGAGCGAASELSLTEPQRSFSVSARAAEVVSCLTLHVKTVNAGCAHVLCRSVSSSPGLDAVSTLSP
jgi:hypothetical protein